MTENENTKQPDQVTRTDKLVIDYDNAPHGALMLFTECSDGSLSLTTPEELARIASFSYPSEALESHPIVVKVTKQVWESMWIREKAEWIITDVQLDNMLHALGKSRAPSRAEMGWRNYYVTDRGGSKSWDDLVSKGLAERGYYVDGSDKVLYRVSEFGLKLLGVTLK